MCEIDVLVATISVRHESPRENKLVSRRTLNGQFKTIVNAQRTRTGTCYYATEGFIVHETTFPWSFIQLYSYSFFSDVREMIMNNNWGTTHELLYTDIDNILQWYDSSITEDKSVKWATGRPHKQSSNQQAFRPTCVTGKSMARHDRLVGDSWTRHKMTRYLWRLHLMLYKLKLTYLQNNNLKKWVLHSKYSIWMCKYVCMWYCLILLCNTS
jgi:hypothetical protein